MSGRDPGLQQERTSLAWRRTGLALLVATLVIGRLTLMSFGIAVIVLVAFSIALGLAVVLGSLRSGQLAQPHPDEPQFRVLRDGRLPAIVAITASLLALGELSSAIAQLL